MHSYARMIHTYIPSTAVTNEAVHVSCKGLMCVLHILGVVKHDFELWLAHIFSFFSHAISQLLHYLSLFIYINDVPLIALFAVSLQPQQGEFPGSENYKHKFMVQTMFAPDGEYDADQLVIIQFFVSLINFM